MAKKVPITIYFLATLAGFMAAVADGFLNQWTKAGRAWLDMAGGFVFWNISLVIFIMMLQRGFLAQSVMLFIVSNCVFALLLSKFWFVEELSLVQWSGVGLAVFSLALMELG